MLRRVDSFDHYGTSEITRKWTQLYNGHANTATIAVGAGRRGTNALRFSTSGALSSSTPASLVVPGTDELCLLGFAFRASGTGSWATTIGGSRFWPFYGAGTFTLARNAIAYIRSTGVSQIILAPFTNGQLGIWRSDHSPTLLGRTDDALNFLQYYYIEIDALITDEVDAGHIHVYVNGDLWFALDDFTTYYNGAAEGSTPVVGWDEVVIGKVTTGGNAVGIGGTLIFDYDDFYVGDGDASSDVNTVVSRIGDIRVDWRAPTLDDLQEWTPSEGSDHFALVDDNPADDDLTYNSAIEPGLEDTFDVQDAPVVGVGLVAVQVIALVRRTEGGDTATRMVFRTGGTSYYSAARGNTTSNTFQEGIWTQNPATLGVLSAATFNGSFFGYEKAL